MLTIPMSDILGALAGPPLHGYAIAKRIVELRGGNGRRMGPATLYTSIQKLLEMGLIEELEAHEGDRRRRPYRLTPQGLSVIAKNMAQQRQFLDAVEAQLNGQVAGAR